MVAKIALGGATSVRSIGVGSGTEIDYQGSSGDDRIGVVEYQTYEALVYDLGANLTVTIRHPWDVSKVALDGGEGSDSYTVNFKNLAFFNLTIHDSGTHGADTLDADQRPVEAGPFVLNPDDIPYSRTFGGQLLPSKVGYDSTLERLILRTPDGTDPNHPYTGNTVIVDRGSNSVPATIYGGAADDTF